MDATRRSRPADEAPRPDAAARAARRSDDEHALGAAIAASLADALRGGGRVAIAFSGGPDSTALLDAALDVAPSLRAEVVALHVHHGLSPHADDWLRHCADFCAARGVPFLFRRVAVLRRARTSVEAEARRERYRALAGLAREAGAAAVLLAQHANDQAETLLLQLARGAGPRGLAAMPGARVDGGIRWLRPFLALPRATLEAHLRRRRLRFVDDESNRDRRLARSALRAEVVPALARIAPGYPGTFVRAARHQAEAAQLLDELARLDAGDEGKAGTLACARLRELGAPRARNLLRWFLRESGLPAPSSARLDEFLRKAVHARDGTCVTFAHAGACIGIRRGRLAVHPPVPAPYAHTWDGSNEVRLAHGSLAFVPTTGRGVAARHLGPGHVSIRSGKRGERIVLAGRPSRRSVAELLREAGIARWDRLALPRVHCDDVLAAIPGVGVAAALAAEGGEPAFAIHWFPMPR